MAITKLKKTQLIANYSASIETAKAVVVVKQSGLGVNDTNALRMSIYEEWGNLTIAKKRLLMRSVAQSWFEVVEHKVLDGSIMVVYSSTENEFGPLKTINTFLKKSKKEEKKIQLTFIWWRFDKQRKDGLFVNELANLPSKEELIAKLLRLMNYNIQSFVSVLDQISKK